MAKKNVQRENWSNWLDFFFSAIGYIVGLGNIWRFPYLCYKNGGGAFLIPYFIILFITAVPLMFIELSYSQYCNLGPVKIWVMCPLFKGIGYGVVIHMIFVSIYYTTLLTWSLYYLYNSMFSVLPWRHCSNIWNTPDCYETVVNPNRSLFSIQSDNETQIGNLTQHIHSNSSFFGRNPVSASEEFWKHHVLGITDGVEDLGGIQYPLLLCLAISWILIFVALSKGIKTSGKVVYVTATVPYLLLTILLGRAVTLPGSKDGLIYYMMPKWEKLKDFSVWKDAAVQIFYSAGIGASSMVTLSSYNKFHNNCQRDATILPIIDGVTSWFAGLITFSVIGYMSHISNTDISHVITQGPGVAFVVYPEALSTLPFAQLWSSIFFIMLFLVGLDSQFVHIQVILTSLTDAFPEKMNKRKVIVTGALCTITFLLGIPCVTQGGMYVLQILDWYCSSISLLFFVFMESVAVCWIYGITRFFDDITLMLGYKPYACWKLLCKFVAPLSTLGCWILTLIVHSPLKYDSGEPFPVWVSYVGIFIALLSVVTFPIAALQEILSLRGPFIKRLKTSMKPTPEWLPAIKKEYTDCHEDTPMSTTEIT